MKTAICFSRSRAFTLIEPMVVIVREEIKKILERSTLKTWRKDKAKVLDLLAELSNQSPGSRQMAINSRA